MFYHSACIHGECTFKCVTYTHKYLPPYIHTYMHTYFHIYIYAYIHTYTYIQTYLHTKIHSYIHSHIPYFLYMYRNRYTCMCTYIHALHPQPFSVSGSLCSFDCEMTPRKKLPRSSAPCQTSFFVFVLRLRKTS